MPYAIPYARFSSGKQAAGSSLERQRILIGSWLRENPKYSLYPEQYEDLGRSGASGEHLKHGFGRLLAAIDEGHIKSGDVILLESIDRAGRLEELEMLSIFQRIIAKGVSIVTIDDGATYDQEMGGTGKLWQLLGKVQQAFNYSETLSRRVSQSYEARRRTAKSGSPIKRRTPVWLSSSGELKQNITPFIKQAFESYAAGIGERRILKELRGKTPEFETLNPTTIKRWLTNKTAIGYWNDIPNVYPSVVTKDLYYRVQKRLQSKYKPASSPTKHLLSGLVICGNCGSNFTYKKHKHSPPTMGCSRRARLGQSGCSNSKTMPAQILDYIRSTTSYPSLIRAMIATKLNDNEVRISDLNGEIEDTLSRQVNLTEMIQEFGLTEHLKKEYSNQKERLEKLNSEKAYLSAQSSPSHINEEHANELENDLFDTRDTTRLNALLQTGGYKIICSGNKATVDISQEATKKRVLNITYHGIIKNRLTSEEDKDFYPKKSYKCTVTESSGTEVEELYLHFPDEEQDRKALNLHEGLTNSTNDIYKHTSNSKLRLSASKKLTGLTLLRPRATSATWRLN